MDRQSTLKEDKKKEWNDLKIPYTNSISKVEYARQKYGLENWKHETLEVIKRPTKEKLINALNEREIFYIKKYNTFNKGYNSNQGGEYIREVKKLVAYTFDLKFISNFECIEQASEYLRVPNHSISSCVRGESKVTGEEKYILIYRDNLKIDTPEKRRQEFINKQCPAGNILKLDLVGNIVERFGCIFDYSKKKTKETDEILSSCWHIRSDGVGKKGIHKLVNGYIWCYEKDYIGKEEEFFYSPLCPKQLDNFIQFDVNGNIINYFYYQNNFKKFIKYIYEECEGNKRVYFNARKCGLEFRNNPNNKIPNLIYNHFWMFEEDYKNNPERLKHFIELNRQKVYQFNTNGELIGSFYLYKNKIVDQRLMDLGLKPEWIKNCCERRKGNRYYAGYVWTYADRYNENEDYSFKNFLSTKQKSEVSISQFDINGKFIKTYPGYLEILNSVKSLTKVELTQKGIFKCCRSYSPQYPDGGKRVLSSCGYIWVFTKDYENNPNIVINKLNKLD